jgi:hypothetical protein
MMEAASTSETLVSFYQTAWHNNEEDNHFHILQFQKKKIKMLSFIDFDWVAACRMLKSSAECTEILKFFLRHTVLQYLARCI